MLKYVAIAALLFSSLGCGENTKKFAKVDTPTNNPDPNNTNNPDPNNPQVTNNIDLENCGNGVLDPGELCDPLAEGDGACPFECESTQEECGTLELVGNPDLCTASCAFVPAACGTGDGCCPFGCDSSNDAECTNTCGNDIVEGNEVCDGDCPTTCDSPDSCSVGTVTGSAATCTAECSFTQITSCQNNDGCCPAGCTAQTDNDCSCNPTSTCQGLGAECGSIFNGCENISCGQCGVGESCEQNECVQNTPPPTNVGKACTSNANCGAGLACLPQTDGVAGGYCTKGCASNSDCGSGSHCGFFDDEGTGICLKSCGTNSDCGRSSYECFGADSSGPNECWQVGSGSGTVGAACQTVANCAGGQDAICISDAQGFYQGYCSLFCNSNADCDSASHCSIAFGLCLRNTCSRATGYERFDADGDGVLECFASATGSAGIGQACDGDWDCAGGQWGRCLSDADGFPGGYCTLACGFDQGTCPSGATCWEANTDTSICVDQCDDFTCRSGYSCFDPDGNAGNICWL